jgi:hypothetical protein
LRLEHGVALIIAFYRDRRAEDCPPDCDGDMLLYQWGVYGDGLFELDLTRQFVFPAAEDDDIWQLSLSFKFPPSEALKALGSGNKWCHEIRRRAVDYFEGYIKNSDAYRAVTALDPLKTDLIYFNAG